MKFFMWKPPFLTSSVRWSSLFAASSSSSSFFLRSYLSKPLLHHRHHLSLPSVKVPSTSSSSHSTSFLFRRSTWLVAFTTLPTLFILWHGYPSEIHQTHLHGTWRSFNTLLYVSNIMFKYKKVFWNFGHFGIDSDIYLEEREKVHQQSADLLLELCRMHGGIYIKAAQHLASMLRIVPKAYTDTLSVLQDKAPFRSFEEIANVIVKEFGMHPSDLFLEFDQKPLAAASLAQVHRAVTHQMEECAVKVQYPEVQRNFHIDIRCMEVLTKLVSLIFPEFHLGWIVQEFKSNLLQEFDFELEAHHSETTAGRFQHHKHFHVPKVIWPLTTHKVLTMEYIRGLPLKSVEELQKQGVSTYQIAQTLIDIFSEMVFVHGFVHCDPHPGNFLIRIDPHAPHLSQLVLLDHGLYRTLDPHFREVYAQLWVAILSNSTPLLSYVSQEIGLKAYTDLLPTFFAGWVPGASTMYLGDEVTDAHRHVLKQTLRRFQWTDAMAFLASVQRDMLFVMRTFMLVGAVHRQLGGTNAQKFRTYAWVSLNACTHGWDRVWFGARILWYLWVLRGWRKVMEWSQGTLKMWNPRGFLPSHLFTFV